MRNIWITVCVVLSFSTSSLAEQKPDDIPPGAFASLDKFTHSEISPSGDKLAYLYPLKGRQHVVIHTFESKANVVIPPIDTLDFNWLEWANNDTLVFSMSLSARRTGRITVETEETRLIAFNVNSKKVTPLIKPAEIVGQTGSRVAKNYFPEAQVQDDVIDWLPDDPDHILVALDEDFDSRFEVRKVDVNTGNYRIHRKSIDGVQSWIVDQAGEIRLGIGWRLGERRIVFKDATGDWLPLNKTDWFLDGWSPISFTDNPEVIIVTGFGGHGTREARTLNTSTGEFLETLFSDPGYDVEGIRRHPNGRQNIGVTYTDDLPQIDYFDTAFAKLQSAVDRALPGSSNYIRSVSTDLRHVVIHSSNSREPGMILIWDRVAKTMEPFGWFNDVLDPELLADVAAVEFQSADGTVIPAYLTLPIDSDARELPAVVLPHGGPSSRDDKSYWFLTQFLVSRGYAVLQPNFRGSSGYGWRFRDAGRGQWGGLMQDDVDAGARWLVDEGIADPKRMCIVGWSYGGYSAAMGLIKAPDLYRCGVGINGVYNLPKFIAARKEYVGGTAWTRHIGLEGEKTRAVSPHHQADEFEAPFLIIHAADDHRVRVGQAEQLYAELVENGKSAKLVRVEHGGHSMVTEEARVIILQELETFLAENIGGH